MCLPEGKRECRCSPDWRGACDSQEYTATCSNLIGGHKIKLKYNTSFMLDKMSTCMSVCKNKKKKECFVRFRNFYRTGVKKESQQSSF